jgi:hypothetical protein
MLTAPRAVAPKTRKGRTATVRPSAILLTSNADLDSTTAFRIQRLTSSCGLVKQRANLLAALIWGDEA